MSVQSYSLHPSAICESTSIGKGTRIWAFAHILPGARVGEDCNVCDGVFIENDVVVGNRVTIKCGVQLWDGIEIQDDVFIGPNVTFTNDRFPRSKQYPESFARTVVARNASIGGNATILPGITIGTNAMIGAGAVVTRSVPPNAIVVGNPARITGYVEADSPSTTETSRLPSDQSRVLETSVAGVTQHIFKAVSDMRGGLSVGEFERDIPFKPARYFFVHGVPTAEIRGEHAHLRCHQFLVAASGSVRVVADDGSRRQEFLLNKNNIGIYLPPMIWGIQYDYSPDAVLLVFASDYYDADDYIRDYGLFKSLAEDKKERREKNEAN
ncbi:WxcM-like domain-containing protein [Paraburkholderia sp.]|uniref:WxcM-like domain-containing protein n=1 Tax=Paraburkholderia sp. TaxID=1926495 RepID=UPI0025E7A0B4|nr:WxcM-like domain-containing protein [Paraburkholderia sp.]